jgi:hypothetical protein
MKHVSCSFSFASLLAILICVGCNSGSKRPPTYPVSGTVTYQGKPLEGAMVTFVPAEGSTHEAATGLTDAEGKFKLTTYSADDGANLGDYLVKVAKYDGKKPTKEEQDAYIISYEEEQKLQFATDEKPTPPAKNLLPPKYGYEGTSGITFSVTKGGANMIDIKLD